MESATHASHDRHCWRVNLTLQKSGDYGQENGGGQWVTRLGFQTDILALKPSQPLSQGGDELRAPLSRSPPSTPQDSHKSEAGGWRDAGRCEREHPPPDQRPTVPVRWNREIRLMAEVHTDMPTLPGVFSSPRGVSASHVSMGPCINVLGSCIFFLHYQPHPFHQILPVFVGCSYSLFFF
jgi:hypothetical protein